MAEASVDRRYSVSQILLTCLQAAALFIACSFWIRIGINYIENCPVLRMPIVPVVSHQPVGRIPDGYLKAKLPKTYFIKVQALKIEQMIALLAPRKRPEPAPGAVKSAFTAEPERVARRTVLNEGSRYTIQLVTYMSEARAIQEVESLRGKGRGAFIIPSGSYYQVCIDHFAEKPQAHQEMMKLQNQGIIDMYQDAYVRPVRR